MQNVLNEGQEVGVVLPFGHTLGEEPSDGGSSNIVVFERGFELQDEIRECAHGDGSPGDGVLSECGCPSEGGSFGRYERAKAIFLLSVS